MAYLGRTPVPGEIIVLDSIESQFNGSTTSFSLTRQFGGSTVSFYPGSSEQLIVSLGGVIQKVDRTGNEGFYINADQIIFAVAPLAGVKCFILSFGGVLDIGVPGDNTVTTNKIEDGSVTPVKLSTGGPYWDTNGNLGIGTSTPGSFFANCDNLVIAGSGNEGLTIASGSAHEAGIAFADGTSGNAPYIGRIVYNHSLDRMQFDTNALPRVYIDSSGHMTPAADATYDLGSATNSWRNIYTNDLNLSNEKMESGNDIDGTKGNWTVQEGENDLYIINNKNGKKYRFALEEIA